MVKIVVPDCVARMGEDGDERGHHIRIYARRIVLVRPLEFGWAAVDDRIIAEFTLRADQVTT